MKTEPNAAYGQPAASPSSSCTGQLPSAYPGVADFGRAALGLLDDIASLFDPSALLVSSIPVKERPVRALPQLADPQAIRRARANAAPTEDEFKSVPSSSISTPRSGTTGAVRPIGRHIGITDALAALERQSAIPSTITGSSIDTLSDVLLPVRGANARLAQALMPPTAFCGIQRTPAAWRVSQLRGFMDDGEWQQVAHRLSNHTPQRAVALALASCPGRESKGSFDRVAAGSLSLESKAAADWRMDSLVVSPATTVPAGATPLAVRSFADRQAAAVIGSTYHAASAGDRMDCQDGVYLSPHCTVVTDGLGGHGILSMARAVRVAQAATGQLITHLVETIARTEARPAEFLRLHLPALLRMVDHAVASALVAPWPEKGRADTVGTIEGRAAFVAVANLRDGTVAFGVGDCTAHLFTRQPNGSLRVVTFTPQPDDVSAYDVGGLGDGSLTEAQFRAQPFPPGVVERIIVGSDGVFDAHHGHLELVDGFIPSGQATGRAQVGKDLLAGLSATAACDEIITRLTERTRAYWATQRGLARQGVEGLDDVALVVRDFKKSS